jgi:hypothetical protein
VRRSLGAELIERLKRLRGVHHVWRRAHVELPRLALGVVREAGEPLPVAVIVPKMLAAKGVDRPDRRTFELTNNRLHNALLALDARGITVRVGRGECEAAGIVAVS